MRATKESLLRMEIAKRVIEQYSKIDEIDSLAVGGSTARGNADDISDIDILMTYSIEPSKEERQKILNELDDMGKGSPMYIMDNGMISCESLRVDGITIGILPANNETLLGVGDDIEDVLGTRREIGLADIHDCMVLYDPKGLYEIVKKKLDHYPMKQGLEIVQDSFEKILKICTEDIQRAGQSNNYIWLSEIKYTILQNILRIIFILNNDYFPRMKDAMWLTQTMEYVPRYFESNIRKFTYENDPVKIRHFLITLMKDLIEIAENSYPGIINDKTLYVLRNLQ